MDFRFPGRSGHATDSTGMTEFDPDENSANSKTRRMIFL
jgi:hypothetical protein